MLNELTPGRIFGTNIPRVSRFWVNQPKVQGLADGKLTVLSGNTALKENELRYCQDPALTVLSLFNVYLFVLCLSTWTMVLSLFVSAMCSSCPTSLFPLVTPPCLAFVCLIVFS